MSLEMLKATETWTQASLSKQPSFEISRAFPTQMVCSPHKEKLESASLELDTINPIAIQPIHLTMYI